MPVSRVACIIDATCSTTACEMGIPKVLAGAPNVLVELEVLTRAPKVLAGVLKVLA